jgi:hypothetical protein
VWACYSASQLLRYGSSGGSEAAVGRRLLAVSTGICECEHGEPDHYNRKRLSQLQIAMYELHLIMELTGMPPLHERTLPADLTSRIRQWPKVGVMENYGSTNDSSSASQSFRTNLIE